MSEPKERGPGRPVAEDPMCMNLSRIRMRASEMDRLIEAHEVSQVDAQEKGQKPQNFAEWVRQVLMNKASRVLRSKVRPGS